MKFLASLVLCFLCYNLSLASETYRVGIIGSTAYSESKRFLPAVLEASKHNVDIVVLPSKDLSSCLAAQCESDNYDESVKTLSDLAKKAKLYIVAHLFEKTRCQNGYELTRNNLVFDREGSIVADYRKPVNNLANCTSVMDDVAFTTDFGVTFGVLMGDDLVLKPSAGMRNYVMSGASHADVPPLNAHQFSASWSYVNNANLITGYSAFAGRTGRNTGPYVDLMKTSPNGPTTAPVSSLPSSSVPGEDLSHYVIRPVDMGRSLDGLTETVCQGKFCCDFYLKTKPETQKPKMHYGLAVFNGVRSFDKSHNIGSQNCAVFACAGLYKRSCSIGHEINSTVTFEKILISSNFTSTANYPIILSSDASKIIDKFSFDINPTGFTSLVIENGENLLNIAIFGRDFSKDSEKYYVDPKHMVNLNVYDYIFNEDVQEFFDYLWIRLRILIVVVSIYVLEMM
ncbi:vanin-like protein 1 [Plodia interpunctella]|uniref:vanin-like protein 1 n=1 Tax=Plodia interpunctella TaxID=58824 RepID=UPI002368D6E5|nr:vanin-like protein 1 [Plodia interpunctella]